MADRMTELGKLLQEALKRNDLDAADRISAEQREILDNEYGERLPKLTADPLPF